MPNPGWITTSEIVPISGRDVEIRKRSRLYWESRGFRFDVTEGDTWSAHRGSMWGNFFSFDMRNLMAELELNFDEQMVTSQMQVNPLLQQITDWNRDYWHLEMKTFSSWLTEGDLREVEWAEFDRGWKKAAWLWTVTAGQKGNKRP